MTTYTVPGTNDLLLINENRELIKTRGLNADKSFPKRKMHSASLYYHNKRVSSEWLYWLARYDLRVYKPYQHHIYDFKFVRKNPKYDNHLVNKEPMVVYFEEPIYTDHTKEYRIIPRFPLFCVSKEGTVIYLPTKKILNVTTNDNIASYPSVHIKGIGNRNVHILVAMAWVDNADRVNNIIVDHIDGNKSNFHYKNLRWVDFKGNNNAKIYQGLCGQSIQVKVRNMLTGEVSEYPSLTKACEAIGRTRINTNTDPLKEGRIWVTKTGKYEILPIDGFTGWVYLDKKPTLTRNQKVVITITHPDGTELVITSLEDFTNKVFDGKRSADRIETAISVTKRLHPDSKIDVKRHDVKKSYIGLKLATGKEYIRETYNELSLLSKVPKSSVGKSIRANGCISYHGWAFKENDGYDWSDDIQEYKKSIIKLIDKNGKVSEFGSLRKASEHTGVDRKTLVKAFKSNSLVKDMYIVHII